MATALRVFLLSLGLFLRHFMLICIKISIEKQQLCMSNFFPFSPRFAFSLHTSRHPRRANFKVDVLREYGANSIISIPDGSPHNYRPERAAYLGQSLPKLCVFGFFLLPGLIPSTTAAKFRQILNFVVSWRRKGADCVAHNSPWVERYSCCVISVGFKSEI